MLLLTAQPNIGALLTFATSSASAAGGPQVGELHEVHAYKTHTQRAQDYDARENSMCQDAQRDAARPMHIAGMRICQASPGMPSQKSIAASDVNHNQPLHSDLQVTGAEGQEPRRRAHVQQVQGKVYQQTLVQSCCSR